MALVSYDQIATTTDTNASFLYWTIVGANTIEGTRNEVRTFVDTAIFHVPSRRLLFRAPGIHVASDTSTLARASGEILEARRNSYALAIDEMSTNLLTELDRFRVCMEEVPSVAQGVRTNGDGGGAMLPVMLLVLLMAALGPAMRRATTSSIAPGRPPTNRV